MTGALRVAGLVLALSGAQATAATITILNADGGGEGLNDQTPVAPVGGNTALTRGQQRFNVLQAAADVWAARIQSDVEIKVSAKFDVIDGCTANSGTVGSAGPTSQRTLVGVPGAFSDTFYPIALAEALAGANLNGAEVEITATFNSDVDGPNCFGSKGFFYGIEPGSEPRFALALFPVVLHELGHGLGFSSLACIQAGGCDDLPLGAFLNDDGLPDVWSRFLANAADGELWADMTVAERAASMTSDPGLVWTGANVTATAGGILTGKTNGFLRMHAPGTLEPGSSVSHFTSAVSPDEVMEPVINLSAVVHDPGRAVPLMRDMGWTVAGGGGDPAPVFGNGFEN